MHKIAAGFRIFLAIIKSFMINIAMYAKLLFTSWLFFASHKTRCFHSILATYAMYWIKNFYSITCVIKDRHKIPNHFFLSVSNHLSQVDAALVSVSIQIPFLMKTSKMVLLLTPYGLLSYLTGSVLINTKIGGIAMLKHINKMLHMLKNYSSLHLFPEGTRSRTGELLPIKITLLKLAYKNNIPVLVSGIWGTQHILKKGGPLDINTKYPAVLKVKDVLYPNDYPDAGAFIDKIKIKIIEGTADCKKLLADYMENKKKLLEDKTILIN